MKTRRMEDGTIGFVVEFDTMSADERNMILDMEADAQEGEGEGGVVGGSNTLDAIVGGR